MLGRALSNLAATQGLERSSYYLSTKCGRYGPTRAQFDYSPQRVRRSVLESIQLLHNGGELLPEHDKVTEEDLQKRGWWLDNVFFHDVEFVAAAAPKDAADDDGWAAAIAVGVGPAGHAPDSATVAETRRRLGIDDSFASASRVLGAGDEQILAAAKQLFALKDAGLVKMVGISGYPLPTLVRLARLIATQAPYRPIDSMLSYSAISTKGR